MANLPALDTDPAAAAFRQEVRRWLAAEWHGQRQEAHRRLPFRDRGRDPEFSRLLGKQGWIGLGWPREAGGAARSPAEQLVFIEEMQFAEAPVNFHLAAETIIGPAIWKYGTAQQKADFLPAILRGERSIALHYSEPEAGSDLSSLRTHARRDGADWIVNGQKLWATAGKAEYAWLAVRTDPDAKPKRAGISILLVPTDLPGISIRPSMALYGKTFSATFYDNVRVPAANMVGDVNGGWGVITSALAAERVMIGSLTANLQRVFDRITEHVKTARVGDRMLRNDAVVRDRIGALAADLEVARHFLLRNTQLLEAGRTPVYEGAMSKLFVDELGIRLGETALDLIGAGALLSEDAPSAPIGELEAVLRFATVSLVAGGSIEMQRNAIALRGLRLPRPGT